MGISLHNEIRFKVFHPIEGEIYMMPKNNTVTFSWKRDGFNYRKELETELLFVQDDFKLFYNLLNTTYKCEKIRTVAERKCGDSWSDYWDGYFALVDGDYQVDLCRLKIKPRIEDDYTCLYSKWDREVNILDGTTPQNLKLSDYEIEYAECETDWQYVFDYEFSDISTNIDQQPKVTSCAGINDPNQAWTWINNEITSSEPYYPDPQLTEIRYKYRSKYLRQKYVGTTPPPGDGWNAIGNDTYVRQFAGDLFFSFFAKPVKNGRKLNDVIKKLIEGCGLVYTSNFFNETPDSTAPDNFAYDYANENFKNVVIFDKSDVKNVQDRYIDGRIIEPEPATRSVIKLKELLQSLETIYNVGWTIDQGLLRIEHYTYFRASNFMLDISNNERLRGKHSFKFKLENLPIYEKWQWMETSGDTDFDSGLIEYEDQCAYGEDDANKSDYAVKITTNVEKIIVEYTKYSDNGHVLVAANEQNGIMTARGAITGKYKLNAAHSWASLLKNLHLHGRPQQDGIVNGAHTLFYYTKESKESQANIVICCEDLEVFKPHDLVKTQIGWGSVEAAKITFPTYNLELNLLHE